MLVVLVLVTEHPLHVVLRPARFEHAAACFVSQVVEMQPCTFALAHAFSHAFLGSQTLRPMRSPNTCAEGG